ncbi:hypothetical protein DFQ28_005779 [Apophysomyces sp. BC1034]|nr:hypothetical protein DFQ30_003592 [Apophysomyces sp. BC1015]KAG0179151.1 hypothetical protein DFQ29_002463 [Apophysomyces sp. BC1021]KAG0187850.1 hypothetical protein DFQ28_005779 [Apophysomyces sp. BC1034]
MMPADVLRKAIRAIKEQTTHPFAVNLFARSSGSPVSLQDLQQAYASDPMLQAIRRDLGLTTPTTYSLRSPPLKDQIEVILQEQVRVVSFTFGLLPPDVMSQLKKAGIYLIGTATSVDEARILKQNQIDAMVAQGAEAGGHRGTFENPDGGLDLSTKDLVKAIKGVVKDVPVLAAGGISSGPLAAEALTHWHADGVVLGTLFMLSKESATPPAHRYVLLHSEQEKPTRITRGLTGRRARGFPNAFMDRMDSLDTKTIPEYDIHSSKTKDIVAHATKNGITDYMLLLAGANASDAAQYSNQGTLSAAEIMRKLMIDIKDCFVV